MFYKLPFSQQCWPVRVTFSAIMFSRRKGSLECDRRGGLSKLALSSLWGKKKNKLPYLFCLGSVVNLANIMTRNNNSLEKK